MKKHLFWADLEMTGLDEQNDHILEIAAVITDVDFNSVAEYHRVIFQPQSVLDEMNDWCKENHGKSGLTADVPKGTPLATVEKELIEFCKPYFSPKDRIVLVGNSIGNDRKFIDRYLPEFTKLLHYRMIDVSSFNEIFRDRYHVKFEKKNAHRAVGDIHESIAELKHYLSFVNVPPKGEAKP